MDRLISPAGQTIFVTSTPLHVSRPKCFCYAHSLPPLHIHTQIVLFGSEPRMCLMAVLVYMSTAGKMGSWSTTVPTCVRGMRPLGRNPAWSLPHMHTKGRASHYSEMCKRPGKVDLITTDPINKQASPKLGMPQPLTFRRTMT